MKDRCGPTFSSDGIASQEKNAVLQLLHRSASKWLSCSVVASCSVPSRNYCKNTAACLFRMFVYGGGSAVHLTRSCPPCRTS